MSELEKCKLLNGTLLVEISNEESKSKTGLVLSASQKNKEGLIKKASPLDSDGKTHDEYYAGDKVLLNSNYDNMNEVQLDGNKYFIGSRQNILLILERS